jgi:hypothetical protein
MLQLSYLLNALIEAKAIPGWLQQPPPLAAAYIVTVSPWLCFYLSMHHVPLSCMQLLS